MKLTWMITLLSSALIVLLLSACNNNHNSNSIVNEVSDNLNLTFVDSITKKKLNNFQFGISTKKEELPISEIINKNNSDFLIKDNIVIIKNSIKNTDTYYGYFVKKGYKLNKFLIVKGLNSKTIDIVPEPSLIIIKAMDKLVASEIDSISVIFEFRKGSANIKESYKFRKNDADSNLEYFSKYIEHDQSIELNIRIFSKGEYYDIRRTIEYVPWTDTVIKLI